MSKKRLWIPILTLVLIAIGFGLFYERKVAKQEPVPVYKPVEVEREATLKPPPLGETAESGHWHGDEWHSEPHETEAAVVNTAPSVPRGEPFANFSSDPNDDPVTTAYKRLEYIKNNLHEWGDFSPRTLELIDEMTPMPEPPKIEGDGDLTVDLLKELSALRDPRSAEILIKYQMESGISGRPVREALIAMGPGSVPALVARLDHHYTKSSLGKPIRILIPIAVEHRSALGGIVEHIIIPKLEAIAENTIYKNTAERAISELQQ